VLAQANQQKQFDEINRAAILSRIQAARPVQQMGMVSFTLSLCRRGFGLEVGGGRVPASEPKPRRFQIFTFFLPFLDVRGQKVHLSRFSSCYWWKIRTILVFLFSA
jgi:hypothetical protein